LKPQGATTIDWDNTVIHAVRLTLAGGQEAYKDVVLLQPEDAGGSAKKCAVPDAWRTDYARVVIIITNLVDSGGETTYKIKASVE